MLHELADNHAHLFAALSIQTPSTDPQSARNLKHLSSAPSLAICSHLSKQLNYLTYDDMQAPHPPMSSPRSIRHHSLCSKSFLFPWRVSCRAPYRLLLQAHAPYSRRLHEPRARLFPPNQDREDSGISLNPLSGFFLAGPGSNKSWLRANPYSTQPHRRLLGFDKEP